MSQNNRYNGIFVNCAMPDVEHEGVLFFEDDVPFIELHDRHRRFGMFAFKRERHLPKVVGRLSKEHYVLATDLYERSVSHPSFGAYNTAKLRVYGDVIHSSDKSVVEQEEALADTLHVRIDRLEEWTLPAISASAPGRYSDVHFWFALGMSVLQHSPMEVTVSRHLCPDVTAKIGDGLTVRFESRLAYGEGEKSLHSRNVFQEAVLLIEAEEPRPITELRDAAETLRTLLRFVYGERCQIRSIKGTRKDRNRNMESIFDEPIPHVHLLHRHYEKASLSGPGTPLFRLQDVVDLEVIEKWFGLDEYHREVMDSMADGATVVFCEAIAASLLGKYADEFTDGTPAVRRLIDDIESLLAQFDRETPSRFETLVGDIGNLVGTYKRPVQRPTKYQLLMEDLGLHEWGIETATWGQRIRELRNKPLHGTRSRISSDELVDTCRAVMDLMRMLTLRDLGFDDAEVREIAKKQRWTLMPAEGAEGEL